MSESESFGPTLRHLMAAAGVTGAELARRLGVNKSTVSRWRNSEDRPEPGLVVLIARELGVNEQQLLIQARYLSSENQDTPVETELAARMRRLERTLAKYPRVFWLAVIEASERMADVGDAIQGAHKAPEAPADNRTKKPSARGDGPVNPDLTLRSVLAAV